MSFHLFILVLGAGTFARLMFRVVDLIEEEVAEIADRLERLARRFGLLREFRENGLI